MMKKDFRIAEIMEQEKVDHDTAESLFDLELEDKYPDVFNSDVRETLFETEAVEQEKPVILTSKHEASEFASLIGFKLVNVNDVPEDGVTFIFQNEHNVRIELMFDGNELFTSDAYAVDADGNRITASRQEV